MGYCFGLLILCLIFFFPLVFTCCSGSHLCSHHEATALIHFSSSFSIEDHFGSRECGSAGIKSYPKTNSWKQGTDCCSWDGVTCDYVKGHVVALDLSCSWLYGSFPSNSTLFHLQYLEKLNLAFNEFYDSEIPSEFGLFPNLVYLNLSNTDFAGKVPSQVSHLSKLVSLDLSGRYLDEKLTIDKQSLEGLILNLTEVRHLFLGGINMSCINPNVFTNLSSSLGSVSLSMCDLRGKFPKNIFDLPNLNFLDLGINQNLNLDIFKFNRTSNLQHLDLSDLGMSWTGELFDSIDHLQALRYLDLFSSNLWGSIPRSLGNLLQLTHLDLSTNQLSGELPSSLTNLTLLEHLTIAENLLNGTLPSWLYTIPSLQFLSLYDNQFSGHINEFRSKSLECIDLQNNKLEGPIPSSIFQQPNLTLLALSQNYNLSLTSTTTATSLPIFPNLVSFYLSSCNVNEFPWFLKGSKSLQKLDLSNNKIHGKIPNWIWDLGKDTYFNYLNLSHNSFTGNLPMIIGNIGIIDLSSNLIHGNLPIPGEWTSVLDISNNNLSGEISFSICNASDLGVLDLSHNNLSGMIPPCFGNQSKNLLFLNLKKNKLNGMIPPTFAKGCQLSNLNLNGNQLEGPLTPSILNCEALEVLDIGNNNINDTFPHWLGTLPYLQVLILKSNRFHGSLDETRPRSNYFFAKIQIFDLSCNYFTGPLPVRYIKYFKAIIDLERNASAMLYMGLFQLGGMGSPLYSYSIGIVMKGLYMELMKIFSMYTIIDLSNNKFEGVIPEVIGKLSSLKGLNLSHNNLGGYIPSSIGNLTNLEWLDLCLNKLVGRIPDQLASLTSLSVFNVSENQLHGLIPQGKQFNTFGNDSYEGNDGLCGFPVSKGCDINEPPPPNLPKDQDGSKSELSFGWEAVLLGYGCGVVLGLSMGYVGFKTGKPKWIVNFVEDHVQKRRSREPKIAYRNINGRRRRV